MNISTSVAGELRMYIALCSIKNDHIALCSIRTIIDHTALCSIRIIILPCVVYERSYCIV